MIFSTPWKDDPLEYLVAVRFPMERHYKSATPSLGRRPALVPDQVYLQRAADHRAELAKLPHSELLERAEAAAKAEAEKVIAKGKADEAQRFFNLPSANIEVDHWARMSLWTLDQATALSLGKDPRRVNWENTRSLVQVSAFAAAYKARREIILSAKQAGQLLEPVIPGAFVAWAERMVIELPGQLVDAVTALGVQVVDWKTAYDRQKLIAETAEAEAMAEKKALIQATADHVAYIEKLASEYRGIINSYRSKVESLQQSLEQLTDAAQRTPAPVQAPAEKSLGARERESLLKLVIGMAVRGYRYDPKASRSDAVSEIAGDLDEVGVRLDPDTVRKYLHEARDLLPPAETK